MKQTQKTKAMKTINKYQTVVRYYYTIWARDGYKASDVQFRSAEYAIDKAIRHAREYKEKVWVELVGISETQEVVKFEIIFRYNHKTIINADKKINNTIDYKFEYEK